jgi:2',3'-cyclic-nucleotide 2'-phosphodiesterase (5'-nucleotidase family)
MGEYLQRCLVVCVHVLLTLLLVVSATAEPTHVTLLHINDVYNIAPSAGHGGLAELMTLLEKERAQAHHSITTFGGDLLSPSIMSALTKGKQMVELFNAMRVDVAVFGNHEFDFGADILTQRMRESHFPWLTTNVTDGQGKPFGDGRSYWITKIGPFTLGFFGLLTYETPELSSPGPGVIFLPIVETARTAIATLKAQGAEVIVALTHLTIAEDRQLVAKVKGIDIILGGHDHTPMSFYDRGTLILKAGTDAQYLGVIDLAMTKVTKRGHERVVVYPQWRFTSTRGVASHPEIAALVNGYQAKLDKMLNEPIGKTTTKLESLSTSVRTKETTMGNLITDAIRVGTGADVALTNGGGIRGNTVYEAGTILTRKHIVSELPFGNTTVVIALQGVNLLAAIEHGVSRVEEISGRFLQVSGMRFGFDPARPKGDRVVEVQIGGKPLDLNQTYVVATNDYLLGGGDGYTILSKGKVLIDAAAGILMTTMVMDYIASHGAVSPKVEGRIVSK